MFQVTSLLFLTTQLSPFNLKMEDEAFTPAIPIDLTQDNEINLDIPPMTGNEYLRRVRNEALEIPAVVVAKKNFSKLNEKQNIHIQQNDGCLPAPEGLEPSLAWQQVQTSNFARLRQKFIEYKTINRKEINVARCKLPETKNASSWSRLCFGSLSNLKIDTDALQNEENTGSPPLLSIVAAMDQPCIENVLEHHVEVFRNTGLSHRQGQWFYALLVGLQKPLTPEACSSIRTLARRCSYLRGLLGDGKCYGVENNVLMPMEDIFSFNTENDSNSQLVPLNLLICLVCKYFEQKDLGG